MRPDQTHIITLIERCKTSDKNAQLEIYKSYYKAMYNTAYRILKDEFEAEDIMQEAFLTAFTKIDMFKGEVAFGAWLKRIVINKSLTQLKKNNKFTKVDLEIVSTDETTDVETNSVDLKTKHVLDAMKTLKENYNLVLTLHLIEGYDYEEIAQIMNYTNENVRTTISRAKKKLKQILIQEHTKAKAYER